MTLTPHPAGAFGGIDWDEISSQTEKSREALDTPSETGCPTQYSVSLTDLRRSTQRLDAARKARRSRKRQAKPKPTYSPPAFDEPELDTEEELEL